MGWNKLGVSIHITHGLLKVVVVARARVGLIAQHERRPLPVTHRARARVGQQIDIDVFTAKEEGVVASLCQRTLTLTARCHP